MKKVTYCLMVLLITLIVSFATAEAATEITSLPRTITAQGSYIINKNLTSTSNGIVVKANNVTIDLNGYYIAGNNTGDYIGVYINGYSNMEIRNGTIRNFGSLGIYGTLGNSYRVINVRVMNNKNHGILLYGNNHMVKDCTASNNNGYGIFVSFGSMIIGNTAYNNGRSGIYANSGCTVKNNTSSYNQWHGIVLVDYDLVDGNTAYDNNQSAGPYVNMTPCATCVFGDNVAP